MTSPPDPRSDPADPHPGAAPPPSPEGAAPSGAGGVASLLAIDDRGPVRWIRLVRPDKRNAMTRAMAADLRSALTDAVADDAVRVVVLTGTGAMFSSGADTKDLFGDRPPRVDAEGSGGVDARTGDPDGLAGGTGGAAEPDPGMLADRRASDSPIFPVDELVNCPKVTIVALNGSAVGGGATMAMAADLRVCAASASLAFTLGTVGLTPEWGSSYLLWRQIGWGRALDLLLTARSVTATDALAMGLVTRVVDDEALEVETQTLAETIAGLPAGTAEATKEVLRNGLDATYPDARHQELRTLSRRGRDLAAARMRPPSPDPSSR